MNFLLSYQTNFIVHSNIFHVRLGGISCEARFVLFMTLLTEILSFCMITVCFLLKQCHYSPCWCYTLTHNRCTVCVQTSLCYVFIIGSFCGNNCYCIMLYDRILFNLIELHVNARLDSYSFDYTCIIINFYKSSLLFLFLFY